MARAQADKCWTNFDLLNAVKKISHERGLSWKKESRTVAQEILYNLGEISHNTSPSEEEKLVIDRFRRKYFRVISKFIPYNNKFKGSKIEEYGLEIFWRIKDKEDDDSQDIFSSQESSSSVQIDEEPEKNVEALKVWQN